MYDELTEVDIKKMREELEHRTRVLRPQILEDVKTARAFGDLSENFEYKAAKREKSRNESRIRYLERMIDTAKIITVKTTDDTVGLFDKADLVEAAKLIPNAGIEWLVSGLVQYPEERRLHVLELAQSQWAAGSGA